MLIELNIRYSQRYRLMLTSSLYKFIKVFLRMRSLPPSLKKIFFSAIGFFLSLGLFAFSLEVVSSLLLMSGYQRQVKPAVAVINNWSKVHHLAESFGPYRNIALRLQQFAKEHPEVLVPANPDLTLINEQGKYPPTPLDTKLPMLVNGDLRPNQDNVYELRGAVTDRVKYKVRYQTNEYGYRKLPQRKAPLYNIIFLGCSFTFGEGVDGEKTFPGLIAEKFPRAQVFNFGTSGASPASVMRIMRLNPQKYIKGINPKLPSIVIFTYIDDHMRRIVGTSAYLKNISPEDEVYYVIQPDGKIQDAGTFTEHRSNLRWLYKLIGSTQTAKVTNLELPATTEDDYLLTARLFLSMKFFFQHYLEDSTFFVSSFVYGSQTFPDLNEQLQREKIPSFDYSSILMSELTNQRHFLAGDAHPSELSYLLQAEFLAEDLKVILRKKNLQL